MPPKRKQQSTKKPANQKGKKTQKEVEEVMEKESATVAPEAPKELANVATAQPEEEVAKEVAAPGKAEKVGAKVLQDLANVATVQPEEELAKESAVPNDAEKVVAAVLPEVSQEVAKELAGSDGSEQEGAMVLPEVQEEEMEGEYLVPAAKGGDYEEEDSDYGLMHDEIIKIHCVHEHGRQEKEKASVPPMEDMGQAWLDLKKVPHLILGETKEEKDKDRAFLVGLSQLQREEELYCHNQQIKAREEFLNIDVNLAEQRRRLDKLALERRKREEEEKKRLMKVYDFVTAFDF
jgi:hypothetical protein